MSEKAQPASNVRDVTLIEHDDLGAKTRSDYVAVEEPLKIQIRINGASSPLGITMRTPGNDFELVTGFLLAEGVISGSSDIVEMAYCDQVNEDIQRYNVVSVHLRDSVQIETERLTRPFAITSACGVCGRGSIDELMARGLSKAQARWTVEPSVLMNLGSALRSKQAIFGLTGGLHAAALVSRDGSVMVAREDVGRHNAVDKAIGAAVLDEALPLETKILMVSGRTSYEIVQKAISAQIPMVCGISAPSSLAVDLANEFDVTLVGFLRASRFNVYSGAHRIDEKAT